MIAHINQTRLNGVYLKSGIPYLGLFGSSTRNEEVKTSDVGLLVDYTETSPIRSLFDHIDVQYQLEELFSKEVDLVTKRLCG